MEHPQQIEPEQVGVQTGDYVIIEGTPAVNMVNSPEVEGDWEQSLCVQT